MSPRIASQLVTLVRCPIVPEERPGRFEDRSRSFEIAALCEQAAEKGADVCLPRACDGSSCSCCSQRSIARSTGVGPK